MADPETPRKTISVVLFEDFELLDVFGPLEIYGLLSKWFEIRLIGPTAGPVRSSQGPQSLADYSYSTAPRPEIVLVPGGKGTRRLVDDKEFVSWLAQWAASAELVTSVCTGSGLLAAAGLLDGYRATSNKAAFAWAREQGQSVEWVAKARWVEDRDRWTSSGVAAGMDMALALAARICGEDRATFVANGIELEWHRDSSWDPFAAMHGLVESD